MVSNECGLGRVVSIVCLGAIAGCVAACGYTLPAATPSFKLERTKERTSVPTKCYDFGGCQVPPLFEVVLEKFKEAADDCIDGYEAGRYTTQEVYPRLVAADILAAAVILAYCPVGVGDAFVVPTDSPLATRTEADFQAWSNTLAKDATCLDIQVSP